MTKRLFDVIAALGGLALLSPLLLAIAIWIKLDSRGPVYFRQERVGRAGKPFRIHKFRTMVPDAERRGGPLTVGADPRITSSGAFLRKFKLDELPQLIDVVSGHMSLVGPRPEVPKYVALYPPQVRDVVLSVRPGITDPASIEFRDENALLGTAKDPEQTYVAEILPVKLAHYQRYVETRTFWGDMVIILRTIFAIAGSCAASGSGRSAHRAPGDPGNQ
jgi:lipopolysaccharide/colanic/teichoic acid biosynthesis glycosyltransferase